MVRMDRRHELAPIDNPCERIQVRDKTVCVSWVLQRLAAGNELTVAAEVCEEEF